MKNKRCFLVLFLITIPILLLAKVNTQAQKSWEIRPFVKFDSNINPVFLPDKNSTFKDPVTGETVKWEGFAVFNPAAVVYKGKIYLIYRAQQAPQKWKDNPNVEYVTSRLGLASSSDGKTFVRENGGKPILYPDNDRFLKYEIYGGCEDPRIVYDKENKQFVLYYTTNNMYTARLCVATSKDLVNWTKHGSVFEKAFGGKYNQVNSKAPSVICTLEEDGNLAAYKFPDGLYKMYWGSTSIYFATSKDLINWTPVENEGNSDSLINTEENNVGNYHDLKTIAVRRPFMFDSLLIECGPPAIITKDGIVFIYNGQNESTKFKTPDLEKYTFSGGQMLFDRNDPMKLLDRCDSYYITPTEPYEKKGQVGNCCFVEGIVKFHGVWFLYYGTADTKIAGAVCSK